MENRNNLYFTKKPSTHTDLRKLFEGEACVMLGLGV